MSMLADRRSKKKYNLVPRGKALYQDKNRFGTRMLEKMGWSEGKGLGAKEDGNKDFVRVKYKNDSMGFGFEDRDDQWTQHEQHFSGLLESLNNNSAENSSCSNDQKGNDDENNDKDEPPQRAGFGFAGSSGNYHHNFSSDTGDGAGIGNNNLRAPNLKPIKSNLNVESLEEKSRNSKARVHYKKFTRGKDLTQYSEKDLANIFGKKSLYNDDNETSIRQEEKKIDRNKKEEEMEQIASVTTNSYPYDGEGTIGIKTMTSTKSVNDYFNEKMKYFKMKNDSIQNTLEKNGLTTTNNNHESVAETTENIIRNSNKKHKRENKRKSKTKNDSLSLTSHNDDDNERNSFPRTNCTTDDYLESIQELVNIAITIPAEESKNELEENFKTDCDISSNIKNKIKNNRNNQITTELSTNNQQSAAENDNEKRNKKKQKLKRFETTSSLEENQERKKSKFNSITASSSSTAAEAQKEESAASTKVLQCCNAKKNLNKFPSSSNYCTVAVELSNVYYTNARALEIFRQLDLDRFVGSNIKDIYGYGFEKEFSIAVDERDVDAQKIYDIWVKADTADKYQKYPNMGNKLEQRKEFTKSHEYDDIKNKNSVSRNYCKDNEVQINTTTASTTVKERIKEAMRSTRKHKTKPKTVFSKNLI